MYYVIHRQEVPKPDNCVLIGHTQYINSCAVSSLHNSLFTASTDGTIRVWDITKLECTGKCV